MPAALRNSASEQQQQEKTRVQLDLAPAQMERLNWLMEACSFETRKDLVNNALSLLEWAVLETREGRSVASIDKAAKKIVELTMPALADAARNASRVRSLTDVD
jgi:hypothetical protein